MDRATNKQFSVVIFGKSTVEPVPTNWLVNGKCHWPKLQGPNSGNKLKELQEDPNSVPGSNWTVHSFRLKSQHATYQEAEEAALRAIENPSEVERTSKKNKIQLLRKTARKQGHHKADESSSEESDTSDNADLTLRPNFHPPETTFHFGLDNPTAEGHGSSDVWLLQDGGTVDEELLNNLLPNGELYDSGLTSNLQGGDIDSGSFQGQPLTPHPTLCIVDDRRTNQQQLQVSPAIPSSSVRTTSHQPLQVNPVVPSSSAQSTPHHQSANPNSATAFERMVLKRLASIESTQKQILELLTSGANICEPNAAQNFTDIPHHPATTVKEVETLNNFASKEKNQTLMIDYLKSIGGKKTDRIVTNILSRLFDDGLARNISYTGKGNHIKYMQFTDLNSAIIEAVKVQHAAKNATETDIKAVIMDWFRYANSRFKTRNN